MVQGMERWVLSGTPKGLMRVVVADKSPHKPLQAGPVTSSLPLPQAWRVPLVCLEGLMSFCTERFVGFMGGG